MLHFCEGCSTGFKAKWNLDRHVPKCKGGKSEQVRLKAEQRKEQLRQR